MIRNNNHRGHCNRALSPLELYIHIPFCVRKCAYCDFLSSAASEEMIERYVEALVKEICAYQSMAQNYIVTTVFFGGGTPSILSGAQIEQIFGALREVFCFATDAEITIEANPGTVTAEKLKVYQKCGINRISFGLQSTNNEELKLLGRIHTYEEFLDSYQLAREAGFTNINVDLISAIPKQTSESWEATLERVIDLAPEHISAYSLIVEEGTPFARLYGEGAPLEGDLPSEEEERAMYYQTEKLLGAAGYHRYEISNYAKDGKECKHNLGYWERKEYLGIGLGAASLIDNIRYSHVEDLKLYLEYADCLEQIEVDKETLSIKEQMEEFFFLGLRKMEGVSLVEFEETFGISAKECYGKAMVRLCEEGLLEEAGGVFKLTAKGIDVSNYVFAELLSL